MASDGAPAKILIHNNIGFQRRSSENLDLQQHRLPTVPFQQLKSLNPQIPFISFDVGSAAASLHFSLRFASITIDGSGSTGFEDEPVAEGVGIYTK